MGFYNLRIPGREIHHESVTGVRWLGDWGRTVTSGWNPATFSWYIHE